MQNGGNLQRTPSPPGGAQRGRPEAPQACSGLDGALKLVAARGEETKELFRNKALAIVLSSLKERTQTASENWQGSTGMTRIAFGMALWTSGTATRAASRRAAEAR